ncbi:MAG: hypothetical protein R2795_20665 [Saprospiraceae bacterium]
MAVNKITGSVAEQARMALYDAHPTSDRPYNLLGQLGMPSSFVQDGYNEQVLSTPVPLSPNTAYWIGFKSDNEWTCGGDDTADGRTLLNINPNFGTEPGKIL